MFSASQAFSRFYTSTFSCGYFQKIMWQQKREASHPRIKQHFYSKPKQKFLAVTQPKSDQYWCNVLSIPLATTWSEQRFSTLCNVKAKQAAWCKSECSEKCFNERSRKSSIEGLYVCAAGLDVLKIEKKRHLFIVFRISIWGLGALFGGLTAPKSPMATRLGPEQLNDEVTLEIAHKICDWNG